MGFFKRLDSVNSPARKKRTRMMTADCQMKFSLLSRFIRSDFTFLYFDLNDYKSCQAEGGFFQEKNMARI